MVKYINYFVGRRSHVTIDGEALSILHASFRTYIRILNINSYLLLQTHSKTIFKLLLITAILSLWKEVFSA